LHYRFLKKKNKKRYRICISANKFFVYLLKFIGVWQSTNGKKKTRINMNDILLDIAKLIKVARMNKEYFCFVSDSRCQNNMIWTAWHNKAMMVTPAPMSVARQFAYEYYISIPSNLSWIPFSCSARLLAVGSLIYRGT